jgi:hypothetical protein
VSEKGEAGVSFATKKKYEKGEEISQVLFTG